MVLRNNIQTYDLVLVVQKGTIAFLLVNKIKICSAILIFGSGSMAALVVTVE